MLIVVIASGDRRQGRRGHSLQRIPLQARARGLQRRVLSGEGAKLVLQVADRQFLFAHS